MNTRLTLHLDQSIIEGAKYYAKEHKMSLSKLGVILEENVDVRKEYRDHVAGQYA